MPICLSDIDAEDLCFAQPDIKGYVSDGEGSDRLLEF